MDFDIIAAFGAETRSRNIISSSLTLSTFPTSLGLGVSHKRCLRGVDSQLFYCSEQLLLVLVKSLFNVGINLTLQ